MSTKKSVPEGGYEPARDRGAALPLRRMLIFLSVPACVLFAVVFGEEEAHACKCVQSTPEERLQKSSAVFSGVAVEVDEDSSSDARPQRITFEVEESWKGVYEEQIVIQGDGSSCDFRFQEGERYLVYAIGGRRSGEMRLSTSVCQGTRALDSPFAGEDLRALGPPQWTSETNTPEKTTEDSGSGTKVKVLPESGGYSLLMLGTAALLVGGGIGVTRYVRS